MYPSHQFTQLDEGNATIRTQVTCYFLSGDPHCPLLPHSRRDPETFHRCHMPGLHSTHLPTWLPPFTLLHSCSMQSLLVPSVQTLCPSKSFQHSFQSGPPRECLTLHIATRAPLPMWHFLLSFNCF